MKTRYLLLFLLLSITTYSQEKFDVFFDFNIDVPNESSVKNFQNWISENPKAEITKIYGYCDSVDDKSYNKELSAKRINEVITPAIWLRDCSFKNAASFAAHHTNKPTEIANTNSTTGKKTE